MARARARLTYANVMATIAVFIALGGGAYAASGGFVSSSGVIHGCVGKHGALTVVKSGKKCPKRAHALAFNQKGVAGTNGQAGPAGPATGLAGGDLTGNFPNPSIKTGAVTPDKLAAPPAWRIDSLTGRARLVGGTLTQAGDLDIPSGQRWVLCLGGSVDIQQGGEPFALFGNEAGVAGIYEVSAGVVWPNASAGTLRWLMLGATDDPGNTATDDVPLVASQAEPAVGGASTIQNVSTFVRLDANETVFPIVEQTSESPLTIDSDPQTYFGMVWVGPASG